MEVRVCQVGQERVRPEILKQLTIVVMAQPHALTFTAAVDAVNLSPALRYIAR